MKCILSCFHIEEKGEIITPTFTTSLFKPVHPLWLSLNQKTLHWIYSFLAGRAIRSSCWERTDRSRQEPGLSWRQLKLQPVPKIDIKSPAGSSSLHGCPRHGNHSTIIMLFSSSPISPDLKRRPSLLTPCLPLPPHSLVPQTGWVSVENLILKSLQVCVVNLHRRINLVSGCFSISRPCTLSKNSALHGEADFKPPECGHRADGIEIPMFSRWQVKHPMHSSRLAINGSSPHPSMGTTCVGTVLRPHKTIPSPHLQYCSGAPAMHLTLVTAFSCVTETLRPLEIFCSTQRLMSAKHLQGEVPWRSLQPEPSTVVSWVMILCPESPGWQKVGRDAAGQKEQNSWGSFLLCVSSKPFTHITQLCLRTELGASSGLPVSRMQTLQMMQTDLP